MDGSLKPILSHFSPLDTTIGSRSPDCQRLKLKKTCANSDLGHTLPAAACACERLYLLNQSVSEDFCRLTQRATRGGVAAPHRFGGATPSEAARQRLKRSRPLSRVLSWAVIPLGCASPRTSSDLPGSLYVGHTLRPRARLLPYLVLLRVGFAVPPMLPPARCALTAPFHPYRHRLRGA